MCVDPSRLEREFGGTDAEVRVVARQAGDLLDSDRLGTNRGHELTAEEILAHLRDVPADSSPVERWNSWMGTLEIAYCGYERFTVRADGSDRPERA